MILFAQFAPDLFCAFISSISTDKFPGVMPSVGPRSQTLMVGEKDSRSNNCRGLSTTLLKMEGSNSLQAKDSKATKLKSYMTPTTSFMAKMSRSVSVGENLCHSDSAETLTEVNVGSQTPEKIQPNPSGDAEKNKPVVKENGLMKPALQQSTNSTSPKSFHSKLASNRAHLILDIPKSLPDRPTLASFSPTSKSKTLLELESTPSPVGVGKKKYSYDGRTSKVESQAPASPLGPGKGSPASPCTEILKDSKTVLMMEAQPEVPTPKLKESSSPPSKSPESSSLECRQRVASTGVVPDNQHELCALQPSRPRTPTTVAAPAEDSGVHGYPYLIFFPLLSPVFVNRFTIPSHFFTSSFWPVSSCLHLSRSISHPFNGETFQPDIHFSVLCFYFQFVLCFLFGAC